MAREQFLDDIDATALAEDSPTDVDFELSPSSAPAKPQRNDSRQRLEALLEERALARSIREGWDDEADDDDLIDASDWGEEE
ncbi:PA3496 family putative envelope integrity protein [Cobetia amphilecti]|jgi:hypothetical protein|uniref:Uncharacterized protein n=1 Tax=Cobetia amphilecti TaxID=1055104 RepID=A0ABT6UQE5_9GAMM|nr:MULTISPECIES: hypothetical protein [Cobetia]AVV34870.1 hypothetical protein C8233_15595 [Halomonas sp. SF2003]TCJ26824.1 hypothetical protein E0X81_14240 [Halomonas sp. GDM18]KGA03396.1 hypothetical protein KP05_00860 [Cobetia amphilecti]MBS4153814.1 hypothetical protein [Cobetia sp. MC34]MCK8066514.1 hypothetical protein [Cobetia sp. 1CM21F]